MSKLGKKRETKFNNKLPTINPRTQCNLKKLRLERLKDILSIERDFVSNQETFKPANEINEENIKLVNEYRGAPIDIETLYEVLDDDTAIVGTSTSLQYVVPIFSFVDKNLLEPGCQVLVTDKSHAVCGVLVNDEDPHVSSL